VLLATKPSDPQYFSARNRVFLDVNTLLRGLLFRGSHGDCLIRHLHQNNLGVGVVSPHVISLSRRTIQEELKTKAGPVYSRFNDVLSDYLARGTIVAVPDGDPSKLPVSLLFDEKDDDIVMASALLNDCNALATLDTKLISQVRSEIEIVSMDDVDQAAIHSIQAGFGSSRIYLQPDEGSLIIGFRLPQINVDKGRTYLFCTDVGFGVWFNHRNRKFQIGLVQNKSNPWLTFHHVPYDPFSGMYIGLSFSKRKKKLVAGVSWGGGNVPNQHMVDKTNLDFDKIIDTRLSIYSSGGFDPYPVEVPMTFNAVGGSSKFVDTKPLKYALEELSYYTHHNINAFELEDAVFSQYQGLFKETGLPSA